MLRVHIPSALEQTWFLPALLAVDIMISASVIFGSFKASQHMQRILPGDHVCLMILVATNFNKPHAFANQLKLLRRQQGKSNFRSPLYTGLTHDIL
jgi:hypothetical protein